MLSMHGVGSGVRVSVESIDPEAERAALAALIAGLSEPAGFDSEHVGGMIALSLVRAQATRDRPAPVRAELERPALPPGLSKVRRAS